MEDSKRGSGWVGGEAFPGQVMGILTDYKGPVCLAEREPGAKRAAARTAGRETSEGEPARARRAYYVVGRSVV